jgi:hypothetical protein
MSKTVTITLLEGETPEDAVQRRAEENAEQKAQDDALGAQRRENERVVRGLSASATDETDRSG